MASFRIPKRYYSAVRELIALNEDQASRLTQVLRNLPPSLNQRKIASTASTQLESIGLLHGEDVFNFIASLHYLLQEIDESISLQNIVNNIADSINVEESLPNLEEEEREVFVKRLSGFLEVSNALNIAAKAVSVLTSHEHVFLESRILTDIRLVFKDLEEQPTEAVIVHNLKITYRQDGDRKDFFVALDSSDLTELSKQIVRAEAKAKAIEAILEKAEVNHLATD